MLGKIPVPASMCMYVPCMMIHNTGVTIILKVYTVEPPKKGLMLETYIISH